MILCKSADLDRAKGKPEATHDLVPDAR